MFCHQSVKRRYTDTARAQEAKPRKPIFFRGGWEWGVSGRKLFFGHPQLRLVAESVLKASG
jgi:hypothetical protein